MYHLARHCRRHPRQSDRVSRTRRRRYILSLLDCLWNEIPTRDGGQEAAIEPYRKHRDSEREAQGVRIGWEKSTY